MTFGERVRTLAGFELVRQQGQGRITVDAAPDVSGFEIVRIALLDSSDMALPSPLPGLVPVMVRLDLVASSPRLFSKQSPPERT
ncbi:MAG TPA: hypothetical protein ENI87_05445 [bacterium]|nr:hypothetical protein [bacterium]